MLEHLQGKGAHVVTNNDVRVDSMKLGKEVGKHGSLGSRDLNVVALWERRRREREREGIGI
jgi:hypothetical protein